jgi:hypothetical protein
MTSPYKPIIYKGHSIQRIRSKWTPDYYTISGALVNREVRLYVSAVEMVDKAVREQLTPD